MRSTSTVERIMWICCNDSFVSIVRKDCRPGHLLVRARRVKDLESLFPGHHIIEGGGTDYPFRAMVPECEVAKVIVGRLMTIDYSNFKDSVQDQQLHDAYMGVWATMLRLQQSIADRLGLKRPRNSGHPRGRYPFLRG